MVQERIAALKNAGKAINPLLLKAIPETKMTMLNTPNNISMELYLKKLMYLNFDEDDTFIDFFTPVFSSLLFQDITIFKKFRSSGLFDVSSFFNYSNLMKYFIVDF